MEKDNLSESALKPESSAKPESEQKTEPETKPEPAVQAETVAKSSSAPKVEPAIKPEPAAKPESSAKPESEHKTEPATKPETAVKAEPALKPEPAAKAESAPKAESADKPEPAAKPESSAKPESEHKTEPATKPETAVKAEPALKPEPAAKAESAPKAESAAKPESAAKRESNGKAEPASKAETAQSPKSRDRGLSFARPGRKRAARQGEEKPPLRPALMSLFIAAVAYAALFLLMAGALAPERYDLKVGEVATRTITASKDVKDTITTNMLIEAAVREVQPSYQSDDSVMPEVLTNIEDSFAQLRALAQLRVNPDGTVSELDDAALRKAAQAMKPVEMSSAALAAALDAGEETLSELAAAAISMTRDALFSKVAEGQEKETSSKIGRELASDGYEENLAAAAEAIVSAHLRPNMLLDEETTEQKRQAARESVEDVVYKKGQNIIRAGEVVTAPQIEMLNSLGMLKDRAVDVSLYLGLALLLALLTLALVLYIYSFIPDMLRDPKRVALLSVILVSTVAWALAFRKVNAYLMPVTLGAMLTTLLIKPRLALVVNIFLSILMGLLASVDNGMFTATMFGVMLTALVAGTAVIPVLRERHSFPGILLSGVVVLLINMLTTVAVGLVNSADIQNVMIWALWSGGSALISAVLTILEAMLLEWAFNLVTTSKLMELSNPNQPLLRRLLLETPGTYHHSILVANLAEAAASAVGANALLARVGAYYHDIGKLKRPMYFKENQMNDNPHDRTDPRVSTAILTAHPHDGVEMAVRAHLPEEIQDIILQHHGDSPVLYFYDKAAKQGVDVDVADFRYDGPRPRTREAAIVMMADTVEAAARAASDISPDRLPQLIRKMIQGKMEDGQFDECPLTFSDLSKISEAFMTVLTGVYHDRIEYPEVTIPKRPAQPRRPWPEAGREPNDEPKRADA